MGLLEMLMNDTSNAKKATPREIVAHLSTWINAPRKFKAGDILALERPVMNCKWEVGDLFVVVSTEKATFPPSSLSDGESFNACSIGDMIMAKPNEDRAGVGYTLVKGHSAFFRLATQEEIEAAEVKEVTITRVPDAEPNAEFGKAPDEGAPEPCAG